MSNRQLPERKLPPGLGEVLREAFVTYPREIVDGVSADILDGMARARVPRWSLMRLEWDNLLKYGEGNVINFDILRGGMTAIVGPNDAGKSSIFEILMFALYGEANHACKQTIERIGKNRTDKSWSSVWLYTTNDPQIAYRVDRGVNNGRTMFLRVYAGEYDVRPRWSLQPWGNSREAQARLESIIGDMTMFLNMSFSSPGDINVSNCSPADRFRLFAHLSGVDQLEFDPADDIPAAHRLDVLRGELVGIQQYSGDPTAGMTPSEIKWLEEKFAGVDSREVAAGLRRKLSAGNHRDTMVVYAEYEATVARLRAAIGDGQRCDFRWNDRCAECSYNRRIYNELDDDTIESLCADRDRLAAEYRVCTEIDRDMVELAYAEKHAMIMTRGNAIDARVAAIGAEMKAIESTLESRRVLHSVIRDGIVARAVCQWYTDGVIARANAVLEYIGCEYTLSAEINGQMIFMFARGSSTRVPLNQGGGFQRFICGLAIRVAIVCQNGGSDILMIDEGFDCMDTINLHKCVEVFPKLIRLFPLFMIVSHLEGVVQMALPDQRIAIQTSGGVSRIRGAQLSVPDKNMR